MPLASSIHTAMYGFRAIPMVEAKVHDTAAWAVDGTVFPVVLAVLLEVGELDDAALDGVEAGVLLALGAAHPTAPTMAAAESPPRNARRVTAE